MARAEDIKTGLVRASFVQNLFTPREDTDDNGKPKGTRKYGCTLLIPKSDTATVAALEKNFVEACIAANWGDEAKVRKMVQDGLIKPPVLDGDGRQGINKNTGERHDGYAGHWFIRCTSGEDYPPQVVDENVQKIASNDPSRLKSGDYGYAVIGAFTWDNPKNGKGATFGIGGFQKIKAGEALGGGGGVDTDKFFKPETVDAGPAPSETKDGAGAGGLFG